MSYNRDGVSKLVKAYERQSVKFPELTSVESRPLKRTCSKKVVKGFHKRLGLPASV